MRKEFKTVGEYIRSIDKKWRELFDLVYDAVKKNIPDGFVETINYGMVGFVVPLKSYPDGYRGDPEQPLPFVNIAAQKQGVSLYHMALYADKEMLKWFTGSCKKETGKKPDMGKSCIRFRSKDGFPAETVRKLMKKVSVKSYVRTYEEIAKK